jgi:hypothetical protein
MNKKVDWLQLAQFLDDYPTRVAYDINERRVLNEDQKRMQVDKLLMRLPKPAKKENNQKKSEAVYAEFPDSKEQYKLFDWKSK